MTHDRSWDRDRDAGRIRDGFATLCRTVQQWPQPQHLLSALPAVEQKALPQKPIPANPEHVQKILDELGRELRVPPPVSRETQREKFDVHYKIDTAAAEQELRTHYADQKSAAAGGDA